MNNKGVFERLKTLEREVARLKCCMATNGGGGGGGGNYYGFITLTVNDSATLTVLSPYSVTSISATALTGGNNLVELGNDVSAYNYLVHLNSVGYLIENIDYTLSGQDFSRVGATFNPGEVYTIFLFS